MTFKTWINDLRNVQNVVNELKNIDAWANGETRLLSDTSVKQMSIAISGLNKEQALLALSTKNLTDEQKNQVLVKAKLLEITTELTTGQLQERITKQLSSKEDAKALLVKSGLITQQELEKNSTITVTKAKLQEILANKKLSASDKEVILSSLGVANANNKESLSYKLIGNSIKEKIKHLKNLWDALSSIKKLGLGVVGIIAALGGIFVYFSQNVERTKKKLEESANAYKEVKGEVENLNSELQTTQTRIDELNAKQNLTLVESEELDKLKETNKELERELRIRESIALEKGKEANKDAVKYFNAESTYGTSAGTIDISGDQLEILDFQLDKIKELEDYFDNADSNNKDFLYVQNEKLLSFLKEETAKTVEEFMEFDDNLLEGYDEGLLSRLEIIYQKYDEVANGVAQAHSDAIAGILEKVDFVNDKTKLLELGKDGSLSVDMVSAKFPGLIKYLQEAGISAQELYQYIMALSNPNAINYDEVRKQLMESSGIRDGNVNGASDAKIYSKLSSAGVLSNEGLETYLIVKSHYYIIKSVINNTDSKTSNIVMYRFYPLYYV